MQVSQVQDRVTHAVISANQTQAFTISDDPAFYDLLSKSLYSNPKLAAVREVICNAWDAHIIANETGRAIEITLDENHVLTVTDYGPGIPQRDMHIRYCVYGGSTKKDDETQTGGFGLGCKAPYAYVDHFKVVSQCEGTKTIYEMAKSSGEAKGKPGMTPIVSLPTTETGLSVSFQVKKEDVSEFKQLIAQIVSNGGIKATFNGTELSTLPYDQMEDHFLVVEKSQTVTAKVNVRYGNVVYPVADTEEYTKLYDEVSKKLDGLASSNRYVGTPWRIIFQAPPNTISVTPSRESLQMTPRTIETIKGLMERFLDTWNQREEADKLELGLISCEQEIRTFRPGNLVTTSNSFLFGNRALLYERSNNVPPILGTYKELSKATLWKAYPKTASFRRKDLEQRIRLLTETGFGGPTNRGKLQTFLREYLTGTDEKHVTWFQVRIAKPLVTKLKDNPELTPQRLMVWTENDDRGRRYNEAPYKLYEVTKFAPDTMAKAMPYLRNMIVLTHNRPDLTDRLPHMPIIKNGWMGHSPAQCLVYLVQRSDPKIAEARKFFAAQGLTVIDLTKRYPWEAPVTPVQRTKTPKEEKKKKGLPLLSTVLADGAHFVSTARLASLKESEIIRTETPEFLIKISARNDTDVIPELDTKQSRLLVQLYGKRGGVVVSETQAEKYRLQGIPYHIDWLIKQLEAEVRSNTKLHDAMSKDWNRLVLRPTYEAIPYHGKKAMELIQQDPVLRDHCGLQISLSPDETRLLELYSSLKSSSRWGPFRKFQQDMGAFELTLPLDPNLEKLGKAVQASTMLRYIEVDEMAETLKSTSSPASLKKRVRDLLMGAIST